MELTENCLTIKMQQKVNCLKNMKNGTGMKKIIGIALITILLAGCGEPKIDASTKQSMNASIQKIADTLSTEKRTEFSNAIKIVLKKQIGTKPLMQPGQPFDASAFERKIQEALDNKTADQIIDEAAEIKKEEVLTN